MEAGQRMQIADYRLQIADYGSLTVNPTARGNRWSQPLKATSTANL
jgi:hypothetical protein